MITNKQRLTSQKKIIMDYLASVDTHPSAEIIYQAVKRKLPQISLGTVYRNLKQLKKSGQVIHIPYRGTTYFDANLKLHHHFICLNCGRIIDFWSSTQNLNNVIGKQTDIGKIESYKLIFYGKCHKCFSEEE